MTYITIDDLVHVKSQYWILFTGNNDHRVGSGDGCSEQRHETEKRTGVRTGDSNDSNRFMNLDHGSCNKNQLVLVLGQGSLFTVELSFLD